MLFKSIDQTEHVYGIYFKSQSGKSRKEQKWDKCRNQCKQEQLLAEKLLDEEDIKTCVWKPLLSGEKDKDRINFVEVKNAMKKKLRLKWISWGININ